MLTSLLFLCTLVSREGLGMYSKHIPDERITASSWRSLKHLPYYGRMDTNIGHGAWCAAANDAHPYMEIDLEIEHTITGMITQGKHRLSSDQLGEAWVTEFILSFTTTREQWTYVTDAQTNQTIVSRRNILATVFCLLLKLLHAYLSVLEHSSALSREKGIMYKYSKNNHSNRAQHLSHWTRSVSFKFLIFSFRNNIIITI